MENYLKFAMLMSANGAYVLIRVSAVRTWLNILARVNVSLVIMVLSHVLIRYLAATPMSVIHLKLLCSYAALVRPKIVKGAHSIQQTRTLAV